MRKNTKPTKILQYYNSNSKNNSSKSQFDILVSKYVNDMVTDTSNPPAEYFNRELEIKFGTIRGSKPISKLEYEKFFVPAFKRLFVTFL